MNLFILPDCTDHIHSTELQLLHMDLAFKIRTSFQIIEIDHNVLNLIVLKYTPNVFPYLIS